MKIKTLRFLSQGLFFILIASAPWFDIFRFDYPKGNLIILGNDITLNLASGQIPPSEMFFIIAGKILLPLVLFALFILIVSYRYGRLYCGWVCPHFAVVETLNGLFTKSIAKPTIWDPKDSPHLQPDGTKATQSTIWLVITVLTSIGFAFSWAFSMLVYFLPPFDTLNQLLSLSLGKAPAVFLLVVTTVLSIDFIFARHLFCRFGCAAGLVQSIAWMGNDNAKGITLDKTKAQLCKTCPSACDHACPMRLKPRSIKKKLLSCTQCMRCIQACDNVPRENKGAILHWKNPQ
ncbi:MAG: 4Fe-4S binding protein [Methylococcales bacterium]|jgi:ferredoxin-type protein NapH|nr:4Fe-4S binding protein [Methylococcales bacterium]MBT7444487.1 4Fe-4S binding protein [Methylococcales bacterium]